MESKKKSSFTGSLGFILAAAGSAVGLGNIYRFPYLAARGGGGLFILIYIVLALTIGYVLLSTDIALGRKTGCSSIDAYASIGKKWKFVGVMAFIVPAIIMCYYSVIGGWIVKYLADYLSKDMGVMTDDSYFGTFITSQFAPIVFMFIFLAITAFIVFCGVEKGIEKFSKIIMPGLILLIIGIAIFGIFQSYTDASGETRTGLDGLKIFLVPNFEGITLTKFFQILLDATCQLFYSLSVAMGIMITYGSYVKKDTNLSKSVIQIELFDSGVAILAGLMVIPAVFVFQGAAGLEKSGPSLMFVTLPKIFHAMGGVGRFIGIAFFVMVLFAALTSSVSIMEACVANIMQKTGKTRKQISLIATILFAAVAIIVCLGYNIFYFEWTLPNGAVGQILDILDYISNYLMMPIISLITCIIIGWIVKPKYILDEMEIGAENANKTKFGKAIKKFRVGLYTVIIKFVAPLMMFILLIQALGILKF